MILGVMQPYFFPYLGYFAMIERTTDWVAFDTVQYMRHGWVNRNRVLHPTNGWQYITVPLVKMARETPISGVRIHPDFAGGRRILGQLEHYRKRAPHFEEVRRLVEACLKSGETSLSRMNVQALDRICSYLEIGFEPRYFSEMDLDIGAVEGPWDWAPRIAEALGAEEYVNAPGAAEQFDSERFAQAGIRLTICDPAPMIYETPRYGFEPGLSVLDALMWNSPQALRSYLESCREG